MVSQSGSTVGTINQPIGSDFWHPQRLATDNRIHDNCRELRRLVSASILIEVIDLPIWDLEYSQQSFDLSVGDVIPTTSPSWGVAVQPPGMSAPPP